MSRRTGARVIGGVTLAWLACFGYLTLSPQIPDLPGIADGDEVLGAGHFVASLVLTALTYLWVVTAFPGTSRVRAASFAFAGATAFGLIVELIQFPVPEREPQLGDAGLDITGSAVAVAALAMVSLPTLRRREVPPIVGALGAVLVATTVATIVWGSTETPAEERCPGSVSDEPLPEPRPAQLPSGEAERVRTGLVARPDLAEGSTVRSPASVELVARGEVERLEPSGVRILEDDAVLSSPGSAAAVIDGIVDRFTVEAWVRPDRLTQDGPARIVSSSRGVALDEVNFHLGQDRHCLSLRIDAGGPEADWLLFEDVFDQRQPVWHLVATYDRGAVRVFVDGEPRFEASLRDADLSGWSPDYPLLVGNEVTRDRAFLGDVYLVALYDRALTAREVAQNYQAGI